jgi:hypothetical protein
MATSDTKQTARRAEGKESAAAHERPIRQHGESETAGRKGHVGGQGMGQGRRMNAGELHHDNDPEDENDQKG